MSGFGGVQPVVVPDFAATLGRAQSYGINQLAAIAQMRQLQQQRQYEDAVQDPELLPGILSGDTNALSRLAMRGGPLAFQTVLPLIRQERDAALDREALSRIYGGGGPPGMAGAPPAAMPAAMPAPPPGGAPPLAGAGDTLPAPGDVRARNEFFARQREAILNNPNLTLEQQQAALARVSAAQAAAGGTPEAPGGYRAPEGVGGAFAGLPPPTGVVAGARGLPSLEQVAAMIASGRPRLVEQGKALLPLIQAANPALQTVQQGGQVWLYNPRTGTRAPLGPVDEVREGEMGGRRGQFINGRFYPLEEPRPPAGSDPTGQAGATLLTLSPKVEAGTATPAEVAAWRQAYDAYTAERIDPTTQSRIPGRPETPEMRRAREALAGTQQQPAAAPQPGGAPVGTTGMVADPPGPRAVTETTPSGSTRTVQPPLMTPQAAEAARKLEVDARSVATAANQFIGVLRTFRGRSGLETFNPRSEEGARLQQAFENFKMALRSEAFANTGVLQPGENAMLNEILRNPRALSGILSSVDASEAQLQQLLEFVEAKVNTVREQARLPPVQMRLSGSGNATGNRPPLSSFQR